MTLARLRALELLTAAIGTDPARVPADTSTLDRAALIALYPEAVPEPEVTP